MTYYQKSAELGVNLNEADVKETLKIPDNFEIIVMFTVGYA